MEGRGDAIREEISEGGGRIQGNENMNFGGGIAFEDREKSWFSAEVEK